MTYIRLSPGKRGDCVFYVGKRDLKTEKKMRKRLKRLGISYNKIAIDNWDGGRSTR